MKSPVTAWAWLFAGLLGACQSAPVPAPDTVPPEEAKKHKIIYRAADTAPPRTVEDIKAVLTQYPPPSDGFSGFSLEPPPQTNDVRALAAFYWARGRVIGVGISITGRRGRIRRAQRCSRTRANTRRPSPCAGACSPTVKPISK